MELKFTEKELEQYRYGNKLFSYRGKKYRLSRMSYGDFFFEPANWKGGERDGFAPGTIWLKKELENNKVVYVEDYTT